MSDRFKFSLSSMWLFISIFTILLPVFLPSSSSSGATTAIGAATASMFILSFPSSLFGAPIFLFVNLSLGLRENSIEGMYVNLLIMFALGLVQWFWIVPRIWRGNPSFQTIEIPTGFSPPLVKPVPEEVFSVYDCQDDTPMERVIRDSE